MSTTLHVGDDFTITENGKFTAETIVHLNQLGFPDTMETTIDIEGDVVQGGSIDGTSIDTTPAGVYNAVELIRAQINTQSPARFYVDVDGTTAFDFEPSECINSPIITSFRTIDDKGAGDSHFKYGMTVYVRQKARTDGVLELQTSIITQSILTEQGPRPIRKQWNVSCKGVDVNVAHRFVLSLKPSAPTMIETIGRFFQEGRVTGEWIWDYNQNQKIEEKIIVTGLGPSYSVSTQVGEAGQDGVMPLIHLAPRQAIRVLLTGTISSTDPNVVVQPPLHWHESDEFFHDLGNENVGERVIYDDLRGIYRLDYEERWIGRSYVPPDHRDHLTVPVLPEPSDGPIASLNR